MDQPADSATDQPTVYYMDQPADSATDQPAVYYMDRPADSATDQPADSWFYINKCLDWQITLNKANQNKCMSCLHMLALTNNRCIVYIAYNIFESACWQYQRPAHCLLQGSACWQCHRPACCLLHGSPCWQCHRPTHWQCHWFYINKCLDWQIPLNKANQNKCMSCLHMLALINSRCNVYVAYNIFESTLEGLVFVVKGD